MTKKHIHPRQLHYQITPEDYTALRACLSARAGEEKAGSGHSMFFASYRDYIPVQSRQELAVPERADPHFSLHYYDNDPT